MSSDRGSDGRLPPVLAQKLIRDLAASVDVLDKEKRRWEEQWQLSLSLGNGAGLLGLSAIIISEQAVGLRLPMVVAAWFFLAGLCVGGAIPLLRSIWIGRSLALAQRARGFTKGIYTEDEVEFDDRSDIILLLAVGVRAASILASILFLAGAVTPLVAITLDKRGPATPPQIATVSSVENSKS